MSYLCPRCGAPPMACALAACDPGGGVRRLPVPTRGWPVHIQVGDVLQSKAVPDRTVEVYRTTERGIWWRLLTQGTPQSGQPLEKRGFVSRRSVGATWQLVSNEAGSAA